VFYFSIGFLLCFLVIFYFCGFNFDFSNIFWQSVCLIFAVFYLLLFLQCFIFFILQCFILVFVLFSFSVTFVQMLIFVLPNFEVSETRQIPKKIPPDPLSPPCCHLLHLQVKAGGGHAVEYNKKYYRNPIFQSNT